MHREHAWGGAGQGVDPCRGRVWPRSWGQTYGGQRRRRRRPGRRGARIGSQFEQAMRRFGTRSMPVFRSVVSVLVRFVVRSFSTNSRPACRAACGRPRAGSAAAATTRGTGLASIGAEPEPSRPRPWVCPGPCSIGQQQSATDQSRRALSWVDASSVTCPRQRAVYGMKEVGDRNRL